MISTSAVIADSEPQQLAHLRESLQLLWPALAPIGEARDGLDALRVVSKRAPCVLFLETSMPRMSGLEVAAHVRGRCHVVFLSANEGHALAAFDHGAVDFLLKPYSTARLAATVGRLQERLGSAPTVAARPQSPEGPRGRLRWIKALEGTAVRLLAVEHVCYFQADSKYTRVVTADHECLIRKSVKELIAELDPETFWQIHRSTVVNVHAIAAVHRTAAGACELGLKERREVLQVSASYGHLFKQM